MNKPEKIKQIRKHKNLSQSYVAEIIGISQAAYAKIESGETKSITIEIGKGIAKALEISFNELFEIDATGSLDSENDDIKSLEADIRLLEKQINIQDQIIENLSNEKEYIKIFLIIQVVRNAISHLGQLDNLIELATDENLIERLKGHRKSALILYKFSKEQFIKVGFLKQVDFDNYLNDNTDQSPIIEELKNI